MSSSTSIKSHDDESVAGLPNETEEVDWRDESHEESYSDNQVEEARGDTNRGDDSSEDDHSEPNALTRLIARFPRFWATLFYAASVSPAAMMFVGLFGFMENEAVPLTWPNETLSCYNGYDPRTAEFLETENGTICCNVTADCSRLLRDPYFYTDEDNTTWCGFVFKLVAGDDQVYLTNSTFQPVRLEEPVREPSITFYAWLHAAVGIALGVAATATNGSRHGIRKSLGVLSFIAAEVLEAYFAIDTVPSAVMSDLYEASNNDVRVRLEKFATVFSLLGIYSVTCFDHLLMAVSLVVHCVGHRTPGTLESDAWYVRDYYVFLLLLLSLILEGGLGALGTTAAFFGCHEIALDLGLFLSAAGVAVLGCCCCCCVGYAGWATIVDTMNDYYLGDDNDFNPFRWFRFMLSLLIVEIPGILLNPELEEGIGAIFAVMIGYTGVETLLEVSACFEEPAVDDQDDQ